MMALGVFGFAIADAVTKALVADCGTWQILTLSRFPSLLLALGLIWAESGRPWRLRSPFLAAHALRGFLILATMWCFYEALRDLPLADSIAIAFAAPLFVVALSALLLGERVGRGRWSAVAIGFIGVVLTLNATANATGGGIAWSRWLSPAALLVLLSAFFYALLLIALRHLAGRESGAKILFYGNFFALVFGFYPAYAEWRPIDLAAWGLIALQGLASAFGQFFLIRAFRFGEASLLAPVEYTALLWAILFGWAFFGDVPVLQAMIGAAIIIAANLFIAGAEARAARPAKGDIVPEHVSMPE